MLRTALRRTILLIPAKIKDAKDQENTVSCGDLMFLFRVVGSAVFDGAEEETKLFRRPLSPVVPSKRLPPQQAFLLRHPGWQVGPPSTPCCV